MSKHDPKLFREMSEPFASVAEADEAVRKLFDDLYEARKKHRIANMLVTIEINTITDSGEEGCL